MYIRLKFYNRSPPFIPFNDYLVRSNMKILVVFLILLFISNSIVLSQIESLTEAGIQFSLPNKKWKLNVKDKNEDKLVYIYKREPITDSQQRKVVPNIAFIIEEVQDSTDIIIYSLNKRMNAPFEINQVFTHEGSNSKINLSYAIGYKGTYHDKSEIEHTVYVIHIINNNKGVQVILDMTSEVFVKYEKEFLKTMKSLHTIKN